MNIGTFQAILVIGWILITGGIALHDIGAGLAVGGLLALFIAYTLAARFGLTVPEAPQLQEPPVKDA